MKRKYAPPPTTSLPALLEDGSDVAFRKTVEAVWRAAQRISSMNERLALDVGISPPQYSIIMAIAHSEEGATIGAVAERIGVSQPFVTTEISKLVASKLLVKTKNPNDKRSVLVALSPKGRDIVDRLAHRVREINDILFRNVTRSEFVFMKKFFADVAMQSETAVAYLELKLRELKTSA